MNITKENDFKITIDIDSINEFYNLIYFNNLNEECIKNINFMDGFIFRGVSNSEYKLCPSVLRNSNLILNDQIIKEATLLQNFYKLCNDNGLNVPCNQDISHMYFTDLIESKLWYKEGIDVWLDKGVLELAALAQHYGVPTRLLDWSQDVNVAMYFATINSIKNMKSNPKETSNKYFSLWALNIKLLQLINKSLREKNLATIPLRTVIPSYSNNANLCAQKGVLTSWELNLRGTYEKGLWNEVINEDTEDLLVEFLNGLSPKGLVYNVLFKFNFSYNLIYNAWEYLNKVNYTTSKIFPGYSGVANQIKELPLFDFVINNSYSKNTIKL